MSLYSHNIVFRSFLFLSASFLIASSAHAGNALQTNGYCQQQRSKRCSSTIGNAGGRNACCDPTSGNVLTCNRNNPCVGGRPQVWPDNKIPLSWYFNPNGLQAGFAKRTEAQHLAALKVAFAAWTKPSCTSFRQRYAGKTTKAADYRDGQLVIYFPSPAEFARLGGGGSTLAFTRPITNRTSGKMVDADVVFNPNYQWGTPPVQRSETDLTAVGSHEMGHALGFAHSPLRKALMYYASSGRGDSWNNFYGGKVHNDDISILCKLYPKKGPCSSDKDCGGCLRCSGGKCVAKTIQPARNLCKPCTKPADCGGASDICVRTKQGNRCAQACDSNECCPTGYRCAQVGFGKRMCVHEAGSCPAVSCSTASNCGPGEDCISGTCKPKVISLKPKTCSSCTSNSDCDSGSICGDIGNGDKRCLQKCVADNFCPNTYSCLNVGGARHCVPDSRICSCKSGGGKYGDKCSDTCKCATNYQCFKTQNGTSFCAQPCGGGGNYPDGSPANKCRTSRPACDLGASCYRTGSGTICLTPCGQRKPCSRGGKCYTLKGTGNFCLCQGDNECQVGQACNKSSFFGGKAGACAKRVAAAKCEQGYTCQGGGGSVKICQPGQTRDLGEACAGSFGGCKPGLQCLLIKTGSKTGICFENCTKTNSCKYGGVCSKQGKISICLCRPGGACTSGYSCQSIAGQINICKKGAAGPRCGDNTCNGSENCSSCANDCKCSAGKTCTSGVCTTASSGPKCGDNTCNGGENCSSCASDCKCATGKTCQSGVCQAQGTGAKCGNSSCESGENCSNCPGDCSCPTGQSCSAGSCKAAPSCGNSACDNGENCATCPRDCGCKTGQTCQAGVCKAPAQGCGNGSCDNGENCATCATDCRCRSGRICQAGRCAVTSSGNNENPQGDAGSNDQDGLSCSVEEQVTECDDDGNNCKDVCPRPEKNGGCACNAGATPYESLPVLLLFFGFLFSFMSRRRKSIAKQLH